MKMARLEIKSKKHGLQVFIMPKGGGYVLLNGKQICYGGGFKGPPFGQPKNTLKKTAALGGVSI